MSNTTSILGIVNTDQQWTAWSAVGTVAAVIVALLLPFVVGFAGKIARGKALQERYEEVRDAAYSALLIYNELRQANKNADPHKTAKSAEAFRMEAAARARYKARTLDKLSNLPDLSDGAIDTLSASIVLMELILEIVKPLNDDSQAVSNAAETTALEAQRRLAGVIRYRGLPMTGEWPVIRDLERANEIALTNRSFLWVRRAALIAW